MSSPPAPLVEALAGRYRVERELGAGGMATVYLALDLKHHRQVAMKVLRPELCHLAPDRFLLEVQIAARLSHPHILMLHDSGSAGGFLYYVMPYVKGESLRQRLDRDKPLPLEEAVTIARQVAFALAYAHAQGVVHRDVKPENILLHEGEPMVADFGIALGMHAMEGGRLTEVGLTIGTPEYMSPEQSFGDRDIDGRSDVYSLACVLYEMLAGKPPYTGASGPAILARRLAGPAPMIRHLRPEIPSGVDETLRRGLAPDPADRFPSAAAFAEALAAPGAAGPVRPVVAVLPFRNLSPDPDNEYFADGITEDVIVHLAKLRSLDVISRASVMPFKGRELTVGQIASRLNAGTLLDGSIRRSGNRVRIVAQLINAADGHPLWSETYDRELTDIFAIQTDVALQIAAALRAELSPQEQQRIRQEPTSNLEAYQFYLQGRHCLLRFTGEGMRQAIQFFDRALAIDPRYALAHAGRAMAYIELGEGGLLAPAAAHPQARQAVTEALAIDPDLADAHSMLGHLRTVADFDWPGAERAFKRALALQPGLADANAAYGRLCSALRRFDEALVLLRRAQQLDPLAHRADVSTALLRVGRAEEALASARQLVEFDPQYDRGHATLGWACLRVGMVEEGLAALERAVAISPESNQWLAQLGQAMGQSGQIDRARQILAQLEDRARREYVSPYHLAYVCTGLGETDRAIDLLEQACTERAGAVYGIAGSFLFEPLRANPRFLALLGRMQLA